MLTTDEFFIWIKEVAIFPHASRMVSFVTAPGKKKSFENLRNTKMDYNNETKWFDSLEMNNW